MGCLGASCRAPTRTAAKEKKRKEKKKKKKKKIRGKMQSSGTSSGVISEERMSVVDRAIERETASEFERLIGLNLFLLRLTGVFPRGERSTERIAMACLTHASMSVHSISYVYEFFRRDATLESFTLILSFVGGQLRFTVLLLYRKSWQKMLNDCELLWSRLDRREKRIVEYYARMSSRLTRWYLYSCATTIFFYILVTLLGSWSSSNAVGSGLGNESGLSFEALDEGAERRLPYAFVFEVRRTPWFQIVYVLQIFTVIDIGMSCVGVDTTAPLFSLIACGHFDVIRSRLENFRSVDSPVRSNGSSTARQHDIRVSLIHHQIVLRLCEGIERISNTMFLTQLIISTYNVSLVGFKLVGNDPDKIKYVTQLLIALIQLLLCNWPADVLLAKSAAIAGAAYSSPWYRHRSRLQLSTVMLLLRAQKSAHLTAGKFLVLSLETFASMISTSASFFTVVKSMN